MTGRSYWQLPGRARDTVQHPTMHMRTTQPQVLTSDEASRKTYSLQSNKHMQTQSEETTAWSREFQLQLTGWVMGWRRQLAVHGWLSHST